MPFALIGANSMNCFEKVEKSRICLPVDVKKIDILQQSHSESGEASLSSSAYNSRSTVILLASSSVPGKTACPVKSAVNKVTWHLIGFLNTVSGL